MDKETTIEELKQKVSDFCESRDWRQFHNAKDLAIDIINEASELLEHFRFQTVENVEKMFEDAAKKKKIAHEMADVLFGVFRLAELYDIDISEAFLDKLVHNNKKYPIEKSKGVNKKYDEL